MSNPKKNVEKAPILCDGVVVGTVETEKNGKRKDINRNDGLSVPIPMGNSGKEISVEETVKSVRPEDIIEDEKIKEKIKRMQQDLENIKKTVNESLTKIENNINDIRNAVDKSRDEIRGEIAILRDKTK